MQIDNLKKITGSLQQHIPDYVKKLKTKDFFPKLFLIPSEVQLDKEKGLVVIKRTPNHPDKYQKEDVQNILIDQDEGFNIENNINQYLPDFKSNPAGHGLLSLFKKNQNRKIRLAICVCIYSQPKHMLKTTIKGIQESYKHFLEKAGIRSHEIILICIFDGIEKVNSSKDQTENMISYFNEFDFKNGFRHKPYGQTLEEYLKQIVQQVQNQELISKDVENYDDISIFTQQQLNQIKGKLFETQYNEYTRIKNLLDQIQKLKKNKEIRVDNLPNDVLRKYQELSLNYCIQNNIGCTDNKEQIQQYLSTKKQVRLKLLFQAVRQTELQCISYLQSRNQKAILYPIRLQSNDLEQTRSGDQKKKKQKQKTDKKKDRSKQKLDYNYMFLCVKHKNGGKLSSHLLFFQGFCKIINPQFCILLDVGLKPKNDAIYKMWAYMQKNKKCGGVCGYMGLKIQNPADDLGYRQDGYEISELDFLTKTADLFVDLQRAQQFQYHFAHMLDKPFEAAFDYIHVLPGAFSGYRWKALQSIKYQSQEQSNKRKESIMQQRQSHKNPDTGRQMKQKSEAQQMLLIQKPEEETIMKKYLKTAMSHGLELSLQQSNMYLAQDRIMCLCIHALGYDLAYLPDAESTVDPVTSLTRMLGQRRRWINGSWFAFEYVFDHKEQRTNFRFLLQLIYYYFVQNITYISISLFYVTMNLTTSSVVKQYLVPAVERFFLSDQDWELNRYKILIFDVKSMAESIPHIFNFVYIAVIGSIVFLSLSLNQNNKKFSRIYYMASSILGFYGLFVFALLGYNLYTIVIDLKEDDLVGQFIIPLIYLKAMIIFVVVGHALPIIWTFDLRKYFEMLTSVLSYIFYVPTYIHILIIYSFCRIDDLSWGTKGLDQNVELDKSEEYKKYKYIFVGKFAFTNIILSFILIQAMKMQLVKNILILGFTILVMILLIFRLIFAGIYLLKYKIKTCNMNFTSDYINRNLKNGEDVLRGLRTIQTIIQQIQEKQTIKKKSKQFEQLSKSKIFSNLSFSKIDPKLRSKIAEHIIDNNVISTKQIKTFRRTRIKKKSKYLIKNKLKVIEQQPNEDSEMSGVDRFGVERPVSSKLPKPSQRLNYMNQDFVNTSVIAEDNSKEINNLGSKLSNKKKIDEEGGNAQIKANYDKFRQRYKQKYNKSLKYIQ